MNIPTIDSVFKGGGIKVYFEKDGSITLAVDRDPKYAGKTRIYVSGLLHKDWH